MIRFVLCFFWISFAGAVHAQTVSLRSGEHPNFTRFVLDIPKGVSWELKSSENAYDLILGNKNIKVDTSRAFSRVSRDRVASISQTGTNVRFDLACDCTAKAYVLRDRMLVVDVSNAPKPPEVTETVAEEAVVPTPESEFEFGDLLWSERTTAAFLEPEITSKTEVQTEPMKQPAVTRPVPTELRTEITNQVAHAATIGLLQPEQIEVSPAKEEMSPKVDRLDPNTAMQTVEQKPAPQSNMIFRNATTIPGSNAPETNVDAMSAVVCPNPDILDLASWGADEPFNIQISNHRSMLFEEFDRNSAKVAVNLAKTYLHFGFGQEAIRSLETIDADNSFVETLRALAEILEHSKVQTVDPFSSFVSCEGPFALWAALATESPSFEISDHRDGILSALDALPLHLREYLGPIVARRATQSGATEVADRALRISDRARQNPTPDHMLAAAALDVKTENPEAAIETLEEIVSSNSGVSPQAVIELIETSFAEGLGITEDTARLTEALAVELANTELGPNLLRVQAISRAQLGEFDTAFDHLGTMALRSAPVDLLKTQEDVLMLLTNNASDADFVLHAFDPVTNATVETPSLVRDIAKRLAALGFTDAAGQGLRSIPVSKQTREDKILMSTLAIADRKPRQALSYIEDFTDAESETLRARALDLIGDHDGAAALFASANQLADAERSAWMAEDWETIASSETSPFSAAASMLNKDQRTATEAGMIQSGENLLQDTAALRDALTAAVQSASTN